MSFFLSKLLQIIASGRRYGSQPELAHALSVADSVALERNMPRIVAASALCVIGAGPAGVQLAAELSGSYPLKTIHLVASRDGVLPRTPALASNAAKDFFDACSNVVVHTGKRVVQTNPNGSVLLSDGSLLETQVAFACAASVPNSEFMRPHFASALNPDNTIHVNDFLQVTTNIFAIGDVADCPEEKLSGVRLNCVLFFLNPESIVALKDRTPTSPQCRDEHCAN